jgi:hypothetical protein
MRWAALGFVVLLAAWTYRERLAGDVLREVRSAAGRVC